MSTTAKKPTIPGIREADFAHRLGLSREAVAEIRRELPKGTHWRQRGNNPIELLPEGCRVIRERLNTQAENTAENAPPLSETTQGTPDPVNATPAATSQGVDGETVEPVVAENTADKSPPTKATAIVTGLPRNPRILFAEIPPPPGSAEDTPPTPIRIQVRTTANFIVGMRVPVRTLRGPIYTLDSHLPRRKGRW